MKTNDPNSPNEDQIHARPFRRSWMDLLINGIDRLPIPPALLFLCVLIGVGILNNAVLWMGGILEPGKIDPVFTFGAIYTVYSVTFYYYLTRVQVCHPSKVQHYLESRSLLKCTETIKPDVSVSDQFH